MTDTEKKRIEAICEVAGVKEIDDLSDGFHTFRQLYYQRMMLFATIVKQNKDKAWKSLRHEDGELCFGGGWFIVGIDTPEGSYTYHYEDNYFSLFDCEELEHGKHWDGHTEKDVTRLLSLESNHSEIPNSFGKDTNVPSNDTISRKQAIDKLETIGYDFSDSELSETELEEVCEAVGDVRQDMIRMIKRLPSAQPERNTGYIDIRVISMVDGEDCFCSECGAYCLSTAYKFCPKCGIKFIGVRGEQE